MSYQDFAAREFRAAGWTDENGEFNDPMQKMMCEQVLELLALFSRHGHSGTSAPYAISLFKSLASFEPIVPLTGEDSEWRDTGGGYLQNKRCGSVFKDATQFGGQAYDSHAVTFWKWWTNPETGEKSKSYYGCRESAQPITFPYTPKTEYVERSSG